ncbi:MAG: insulinase family protein [Ilumatobacter sp.]|uniref:M16 family metallopeptidase n=1 Tax=Ilumatobacter sp. TaxID=1967498 RepID=UPI002637CC54|nr:M16 family metallopeptidase [Ilumatobacter sp.]MDJ0769759.1 insulinase family protein [Ilumatobacter sp.]
MRRRLSVLVSLCLAVTACSSSDDDAATEPPATTTGGDDEQANVEGSAQEDDPDTRGAADEIDDAIGAETVAVDDTPPARPVGPALPGLLDTTDEPFPADDAVRTGTLDNGLRYYVRANDNPGGKAELRLAIKAGSVNELGPTTGLAHFAEHMLFNGTEAFPKNELIATLRSFGASFGADVNAYTSFDETVYQLNVPNDPQTLELGLTVLQQWLSFATIDPEQVEAERGVVQDEWRVRTQTTRGRLFSIAEQMYLADTPYGGRSPIGTEESIMSMSTEELRTFYDAWYRPDNAAVIVVGEIDVGEIVADIERLFGPAEPRSEALPDRPDVSYPLDDEPAFALHADPDQQTVDVEVTLPLPAIDGNGTAARRASTIDRIIYDALIRRLEQDIAAGRAPFDEIVRGGNSFVATLDAPALFAITDAERATDALQALLDEYERAGRFGFGDDEVDVAKQALQSGYDTEFDGRDSTQDAVYADDYVAHFLRGRPYPSVADEYEVLTAELAAITPQAVDERFRARWLNTWPHVIISAPEAVAEQMPGQAEVLEAITALPARDIEPRAAERELPDALMARPDPVAPESVVQLVDDPTSFFDPIEVAFPNGLAVRVTTNEIIEGQVFFQARSPGGSSLVADDDVVDALYAPDVVTSGGVADFNQAELAEIVASEDVEIGAWITPYLENFSGRAATADLEVLFQLIHLYMTQPRFDPVALGQVQRQEQPVIDDPTSDPARTADDAYVDTRYPGELRYATLPEPGEFATLDLDGVERVWTDRFGDADGWVFAFAGDVDVDDVIELSSAYLATVPSDGRSETWLDVEDPPPATVVETTRRAGTGDTASVTLLFTSPIDDVDGRLRATKDVVTEVLDARLTDVIREELGETYSPRAVTYITTDPDPVIETFVRVTGAPDRVEAIADLVTAEFAQLGAEGPSGQEFTNAFAQVEESYNLVNNGQFIREMLDDAVAPRLDLDDYLTEFFELQDVTADAVRRYVGEHISPDEYIQVVVLPR